MLLILSYYKDTNDLRKENARGSTGALIFLIQNLEEVKHL